MSSVFPVVILISPSSILPESLKETSGLGSTRPKRKIAEADMQSEGEGEAREEG